MFKVSTQLKGLMAIAFASFASGAYAAIPTASTAPADGAFAENTVWYNWQKGGSGNYIVNLDEYKTSNGENFLLTKSALPTTEEGLQAAQWCVVGDETNGYTIYNKAAGPSMVLAVVVVDGNTGRDSKVLMKNAAEIATDATYKTKFAFGQNSVGNEGRVWIELFDTKNNSGNHQMLNQRTPNNGPNALSLWTTCGTDARATDAGNSFVFTEASSFAEALAASKTQAQEVVNGIKAFYHDQSFAENLLQQIVAATSITDVLACKERALNAIDKKLVFLKWAARKDETECRYLGVVGDGNLRVCKLLTEDYSTRSKWQIIREPGTDRFKLRNIASDTYVHTGNDGLTSNTSDNDFRVTFIPAGTNGAVMLHFAGTNSQTANSKVLAVAATKSINNSSTSHQFVLDQQDAATPDESKAWYIEPVGIDPKNIEAEGGYFVIRSNRGLTGTTNGYDAGYPGTLLGVFTPDREKARTNAGVETGVHLRQYMTGMQTIWKIVPQTTGGYKIYSLMGEGENDAPLMGMTFNGNSKVTITDNPTTVYLISASEFSGYTADKASPLPFGVAISSTSATSGSNCFDTSNALSGGTDEGAGIAAEFFVTANAYQPGLEGASTSQGTVYYIERVSKGDVDAAKAAFVDYAQNTRMYELIKSVLTDEDIAYALGQKTTDASSIETVAQARAFLMEGDQAASTRAFERLNGRVVRIGNRQYSTLYMSTANDKLNGVEDNAKTNMSCLWKIEVTDAALRRVRFMNYATGKYAGKITTQDRVVVSMAEAGSENVGEFQIARYYSLDGESFYANLLGQNNDKNRCALHMAGEHNVVRWEKAALASHWFFEPVMGHDETNALVENVKMTIDFKTNEAAIVPATGTLTKSGNLSDWHNLTLVAAPKQPAENEPSTFTLEGAQTIEIPHTSVVANDDNTGFKIDLTGKMPEAGGEYTLTIPAGVFTTSTGELTPELKAAVEAKNETNSISEIGVDTPAATVIYDLQGRRVSRAVKGIYIINGVKTLVK